MAVAAPRSIGVDEEVREARWQAVRALDELAVDDQEVRACTSLPATTGSPVASDAVAVRSVTVA